jgi:hypothetical protein
MPPFADKDAPQLVREIMAWTDEKKGLTGYVQETYLPKSRVYRLGCLCSIFKRRGRCVHIMTAVLNRLDVTWETDNHVGTLGPGLPHEDLIEVPIFFRPQMLTIRVRLDEPQPPTDFRQVTLFSPTSGPDRTEYLILGYLPKVASRKEIRTLFLEWLHGDWVIRHLESHCDAPQHNAGTAPHERWTDFMDEEGRPTNPLLYDHWTLITEGMCMACFADNGVPDIL